MINGGCSSVGRAPDCDSGCRGFNPLQSPHYLPDLEKPVMLQCVTGFLLLNILQSKIYCRKALAESKYHGLWIGPYRIS